MMTAGLLLFVPSLRPRRIYVSSFTYICLAPYVYTSRPRRLYVSASSTAGTRQFHWWKSGIPPLELGNSTAGTRIYSIFFSSTQRRRGAETRFLRVRKAYPLTLSRECAGAHKRRKRQGLCSAEYAEFFLQAGIQINTQPVGLCDLPITACVAL